jgi:medium-chain acyl-[acyl-carrier-protein] hydrolase
MEPLVSSLRDALAPALRPPFAFFGHSMGALVAFELTRALRRAALPLPASLVVAARPAPHVPETSEPIHLLPEPAFLAEIRRFTGTLAEVVTHRELMRLMVPLLRADFSVCETYRYVAEPPLECPISALAASSDDAVPVEQVAAWSTHTTSDFRLHVIEGGHFFPLTARSAVVTRVAADILRWSDAHESAHG